VASADPLVSLCVEFYFPCFFAEPLLRTVTNNVEIRCDDRIVTFPLTSSYWADYSNRITEDLPFVSVFLGETFLLVYDRRFRGTILKSAITMCGFDEESRERWLAFLKLAEIPVHHSK